MALQQFDKRWTIPEFEEFLAQNADTDTRYELTDGVIVEMSPSTGLNSAVAGNIYFLFRLYLEENPLGHLTTPDGGYRIQKNTVRAPDVGYISKERLSQLPTTFIPMPPDIAIEVISPSETYTMIHTKIDLYLASGV